MVLKIINQVCYTIAITSVLAAVVCGMFLIWGNFRFNEGWKFLATASIGFLGSACILSVNQILLRGQQLKES